MKKVFDKIFTVFLIVCCSVITLSVALQAVDSIHSIALRRDLNESYDRNTEVSIELNETLDKYMDMMDELERKDKTK